MVGLCERRVHQVCRVITEVADGARSLPQAHHRAQSHRIGLVQRGNVHRRRVHCPQDVAFPFSEKDNVIKSRLAHRVREVEDPRELLCPRHLVPIHAHSELVPTIRVD